MPVKVIQDHLQCDQSNVIDSLHFQIPVLENLYTSSYFTLMTSIRCLGTYWPPLGIYMYPVDDRQQPFTNTSSNQHTDEMRVAIMRAIGMNEDQVMINRTRSANIKKCHAECVRLNGGNFEPSKLSKATQN